ncbi:hypothetical protein [Bacterioplanoides sp.]|uniref:hypothetical protein n=1 Tax=Bacterioplanoides sp. TaxID=2066072 RepID=UPI003B002A77
MPITDLLIPFGISASTGMIVEPEDAERGRNCNCLCPGCRMPLLSRHPKDTEKRIHFAHDTRSPNADKSTIEECPFNSVLAVKMMAQHVAKELEGRRVRLPEHHHAVRNPHGMVKWFVKVAEDRDMPIIEALADTHYNGTQFDLELKCADGSSVYVWLEYTTRPIPVLEGSFNPEYDPPALLKLDLHSFNAESFRKTKRPFSEVVKDFLLYEGDRSWVFHPNTQIAIELEEKRRSIQRGVSPPQRKKTGSNRYGQWKSSFRHRDAPENITPPAPPPPPKPQSYKCLDCGNQWIHTGYGTPDCPKGCGHLLSRKI